MDTMILGFSGSSRGMTERQHMAVRSFFIEAPLHVLHFGDCVGADEQSFRIAQILHAYTVSHPPIDSKKRAFCAADEIREPMEYLARDGMIALAGRDGLVAAPPGLREVPGRGRGAGTWATVRRARVLHRKIWIIWPDGSVREDIP